MSGRARYIGSARARRARTSWKWHHGYPATPRTLSDSPTTTAALRPLNPSPTRLIDRLTAPVPRNDLFQRIVDGDELALRDAFRAYGAIARDLARRIAGQAVADDVVEEVFLLIWSEPQRWASAALDLAQDVVQA